ncbi:MAG TPA: IS1595 family transposase [Xanthobacteraceae bacterium]|nr:IS1595 family transposase [Xanthobacteraceae bacterium]
MSILSKKYFRDEKAAFEHLESIVWAGGVVCPHCGVIDNAGKLQGVRSKPSKKNPEGVERHGLWKCYACRKQFTAKVGTVFEDAHIPLHKMLQAVFLLASSKKGISAHQLHRALEIDYKSAWFLAHRIREAMRDGRLAPPMMGGPGEIVEVDETWQGKVEGAGKKDKGTAYMNVVLSLVERGGESRTFHVAGTAQGDLIPILRANIHRESVVMTDDATWYQNVGRFFAGHDTVNHSADEYVRRDGEKLITTNTVEGFFSIFKRGMRGVYQHCSEKHLHRYVAEYSFRYSHRVALGVDDQARSDAALKGIRGKRLTYRNPNVTAAE